jgi:RNA polymerase sigma-19 factor, ECF subfamily
LSEIKPNISDESFNKHEFEEVFRMYFVPLSFFAQKFVIDLDTAKEIVHEVFIKIWEKRDDIDWQKSIKSYLYTSVNNKCLNYLRDSKHNSQLNIDIDLLKEDAEYDNHDIIEEQELQDKINQALKKLPEKCREVFMLNRFENLKYVQVADKLNISVKTVEAQMSKALKILREELIQYLKIIILWILSNINF